MVVEARQDPATSSGASRRMGEQLGIHRKSLRTWARQTEVDEGHRPRTSASDAEQLADLGTKARELRRTNALFWSASAFFDAELDRPQR